MCYFNQFNLLGVSGPTAECTHTFVTGSMLTLLLLSYVLLV